MRVLVVVLVLGLASSWADPAIVDLGTGQECGDDEFQHDGKCVDVCPDHMEPDEDDRCIHRCDQSVTRKHWGGSKCHRCDQGSSEKYYQDSGCVSECDRNREPDDDGDCVQKEESDHE
eukprot:TRINITY_DN4607_c0_g1_i5.p2 TRINITY_DN4607_c0_g1~~TRINITY_DN4607_c0_g1_i5.p2  ORF type:complete len:118 (+),score=21.69 TRINITY_DN4607_c0_g1_i5:151-504(+)